MELRAGSMLNLPAIFDGCKVFPIVPGSKDPATEHGWKEASSDPTQIAEWHRINPDFNWAVACGSSGLFVFDIDPAGLQWWADLLDANPDFKAEIDKAFQVRTPKGGLHVYFKGEGPSTASRIAQGIDTRGGILRDGKIVSGGYVLLPGSRTRAGARGCVDGAYTAIGGELNELSAKLRAIVPERKKHDTLGLEKNPEADKPRNIAWAVDLLTGYVQSGRVSIEGKGGNDTAFQVACSILDKAVSPGMCFDLMWQHWNPHCVPPWDDWEIEQVIRNAAEYGEDTEGGVKGFQANTDAFANFVGHVTPEQPEAPARERDRILPLHDYADGVRDPEWLIPNMIPAHGTGMMYGESGSYKSFLALDMSLTLAFGVPGQWQAPPVKNDVLFLAGEGPIATARKRWPAWMQWRDIELRNDHRFFIKNRVPFYTDTAAWEGDKADLEELRVKPSLIVIDTLSRLVTGLDENSSKDATLIDTFIEDLARYYECFVLAIHHTGKDEKKGARGSSVFHANMDTVISTKKKSGGTELRVRKQKDADIPEKAEYYAVKEIGESIVLVHGTAPMEEQAKGKARYDWASREEVGTTLAGLKGKASMKVLVATIAGKYGLDEHLVRTQLNKNHDLAELRDGHNDWRIPTDEPEYDL